MRLWQVLEGFGKFWEALERSAGFAKFCKALGSFVGRSREASKGFGRLCDIAVSHRGSGRVWKALGVSGRLWQALGGFGMLQKALEGFGRL